MDKTKLLLGDSLETLKTLDANSIDAMVTDPPAGISFMGKTRDTIKQTYSREQDNSDV